MATVIRELGPEQLWVEVSRRLKRALDETTFRIWLGSAIPSRLTEDRFVLTVPDEFTAKWVEAHFLTLLREAVREVLSEERTVSLAIRGPADGRASCELEGRRRSDQLDPKYTFDPFVVGSSNRVAHAAALAVAQSPAQRYNPLFIYGGTGLGKTHLLHAIAQYVFEHHSALSVRYVTCERFVNDFINSLRDKRIEGFKERYRAHDLLLVDDIQFLADKERMQEEFFHTFNRLYDAGSQIVISSDRLPRDIATLEDRLRSRFEWGLIAEIRPPDFDTRLAILRRRVERERIQLGHVRVLELIAARISSNVRELEGALTRLTAFSSLIGRPLTVEVAQDVLRDVFPEQRREEVSVRRIQEVVCERFGLSVGDLCSVRRSQNFVFPRHVAMYLCRKLTDCSLPTIGSQFGGRDHTTVVHATSKIGKLICEDRDANDLVGDLVERLKLGAMAVPHAG